MPRPPRFDETQFLDAAARLAAQRGPGTVTMSAVAREAGAPSGSVYHRFPSRPALLAALWLETVEDFQAHWLAALGSVDDPVAAGAAAAREVVAWSRRNSARAVLLLYGPEDFGRDDWPVEQAHRAAEGNDLVRAAVADLAHRLEAEAAPDTERIVLAVADLPLAVVRRHLRTGAPLPPHAEDLAAESAVRLLGQL